MMRGRSLAALAAVALALTALRHGLLAALPSWRVEPASRPVTSTGQALLGYREQVLVAPLDGRLERLVAEGERVARGVPVARLEVASAAEAWRAERAAAAAELQDLQQTQLPSAREAAARAARAYAEALGALRRAPAAGRPPSAAELTTTRDAHAAWAAARQRLLALEAREAALAARVAELDRMLARGSPELRAPMAGTVSFQLDGLERTLAAERFVEAAPALLAGGLPALQAPAPAGSSVRAGEPVARIIDSWSARVALTAPAGAVARGWVKAGDSLQWEVDGGTITARIEQVLPAAGGDAVVLAEVESGLPAVIPRRVLPFRVTWGEVTGLALPGSALWRGEGGAWVAVVEANDLRWQPVQVVEEDGGLVLVEGLPPGTRVLRYAWLARLLTWRLPTEAGEGGAASW